MATNELTIEQLWQLAGFSPNPAQRDAILHVDGPLYLPAGPGSGKTRVLLWRTVNLIVFHGVRPDSIYLSTFTEKAARQLKEGLRALLALASNCTDCPYDIAPMYVGTVHSLCQRLILDRRFYPDRQRGRPPVLIDELGQYFHLYHPRSWEAFVQAGGFDGNPNQTINGLFDEKLRVAAQRRHQHHVPVQPPLGGMPQPQLSLSRLTPTPCSRRCSRCTRLPGLAAAQTAARRARISRSCNRMRWRSWTPTTRPGTFSSTSSWTSTRTPTRCRNASSSAWRGEPATSASWAMMTRRSTGSAGLRLRTSSSSPQGASSTSAWSRRAFPSTPTTAPGRRLWTSTADSSLNATGGIPQGGHFRVTSKQIRAARDQDGVAVVASAPAEPNAVAGEIADLVRDLLAAGKVENENQIAFLFPSLKSAMVQRMKDALEARGLHVYAPRAGSFLEVPEAVAMFGLYAHIFGRPAKGDFGGEDYKNYQDWLNAAEECAKKLREADKRLDQYVRDRQAEIAQAVADYQALIQVAERHGWDFDAPYDPERMKRAAVRCVPTLRGRPAQAGQPLLRPNHQASHRGRTPLQAQLHPEQRHGPRLGRARPLLPAVRLRSLPSDVRRRRAQRAP